MQSVQVHSRAINDEPYRSFENASQTLSQTIVPTDILRTFVAICECGSFTKVARALQLTQPAISAQMKRLEALVGATLISRSAPGIALSARGVEVLAAARRMLAINNQLLSGRSETIPTIRIGVPNLFASQLLTTMSTDGIGQSTNARIRVFCDHSRSLYQNVRNGYLELACVLGEDVEASETLASWTEDLVWMRAPEVVFDSNGPVPLICSPNRILPDRLAIEAMRRSNRKFEIVFSSFDRTAREFAARSGLGYLPCVHKLAVQDLVIEPTDILPPLGKATAAIVAGDGLDANEASTLTKAIEAALRGPHID